MAIDALRGAAAREREDAELTIRGAQAEREELLDLLEEILKRLPDEHRETDAHHRTLEILRRDGRMWEPPS